MNQCFPSNLSDLTRRRQAETWQRKGLHNI